jgi:pyruvate ferredoxin oxidoreductase beta subunit/2-oxoisovalerate ferredoxin oxidoreductase beta subunit
MSLALRWLERALPDQPLTLCIPAGCAVVTAGMFPTTAYGVPAVATTFASAAAVASGIRLVEHLNRERGQTVCWAGDGATYDIGTACLSAAAERDEDILYVCYDNEIYGNTGGQRSSATPLHAVTTTTPTGKQRQKKDIMAIMIAHRVPYAATVSLAHTEDLVRKFQRAGRTSGFRFLLIHSPCPSGWKSDPEESVELDRLAVMTGLFPLYEVFEGRRYRINVRPDWTPPKEYFDRQGRFPPGVVNAEEACQQIREEWDYLERMAAAFPMDQEE